MNNKGVILLAEDGEGDSYWICKGLEQAGMDYRLLKDGEEVLDYLQGRLNYADREAYPLPRVILLDIKMPRLSGLEVLAWIRKHQTLEIKRLPVIMLTNSDEASDRAEAYDLGASSFLVKPMQGTDLSAVVNKCCRYWIERTRLPE